VKFDIFLSYHRIHEPEHYSTSVIEERLEQAKLADRLGYDCIWVPEHHLIHFMQAPSSALLSTQIGLNVSCDVGQMVNLLNYRHPLITAGEIALTDHILGGRLQLGVGKGAYAYEFERLGLSFEEANPRFLEALDVLEEIWASPEKAISHHGPHFDIEDAYVWPRPLQEPHPPLWYAAMSPGSISAAASRGYNVATWPFLRPLEAVETAAEAFRQGRAEAESPAGQQFAVMRGAWTTNSKAEAQRVVEDAALNNRIGQRLHHFRQNSDDRAVVAPEPVEHEPTHQEIYENLIMGTAEECRAKVEAYERLGVDRLLLHFDFGPGQDDVLTAMTNFAEGVIKPLRARQKDGLSDER
jgi:alkanesulfonate monooxygenase SsuD/methylene tetrahydromethanopterin reductase-like flavin-dependent oxidoreductase (luciferase family)